MARPIKKGIDYFSVDVNIHKNNKLRFLKARFGLKGEAILFRLLCDLYENGYYLEWDSDIALLFGEGVGDGCTHSFVDDVVSELVKRGFFDEDIFSRFSVLTSANIQNRYLEATGRRKEVTFFEEYLLVDIPESYRENVNVNINSINVYINEEKGYSGTQSRVEKSNKDDDDDLCAQVRESFSSYFGRKPTPKEAEYISRVANNFGFSDIFKHAIEQAAAFNPANPASYIVKIFKEWKYQHIRTEDELIRYFALNDLIRERPMFSEERRKLEDELETERETREKRYCAGI